MRLEIRRDPGAGPAPRRNGAAIVWGEGERDDRTFWQLRSEASAVRVLAALSALRATCRRSSG